MDVPATRLAQLVRGKHLTAKDFVDAFGDQAKAMGESATITERQAQRWLAGHAQPRGGVNARVLERWFGETLAVLFGPPQSASTPTLTGEELVMAAAHESTQHALSATAALDPAAIEQLHAAARRYARAYTTMPPMSLFTQLVELRRTVWDLLDQTRRPRQQTELYLIAGLITGLMASVSWDLGHPDVAEEQAQAAITYGSVIEHLPLMSWARALQATVTFWGGRPRQAEKVAAAALELAPPGTARVRLHAVHARALAMLGARGEVAEAVERATDELGSTDRDEFFSAGGELAFGSARLSLCAASSYIALGEPAAAEREAQAALDEWARTPEGDRWLPGELSARADLVAARVLDDSLDGVVEALKPVLKLSPDRRTEALTRRLAELRRAVSAPRFRGSPSATEIGEQIEAWTARTVARPSLPPVG